MIMSGFLRGAKIESEACVQQQLCPAQVCWGMKMKCRRMKHLVSHTYALLLSRKTLFQT